jgi:leucyl/phenylalanyl-tRNA---protein transferase
MTDWLTKPSPVGATRWAFPRPADWPEGDLISIGGDLEPATLITAYSRGLVPMIVSGTRVTGWWSPDPRGILPLDNLRVTRSMRQSANRYDVRVDTRFADVIRACANPARDKGWITEDFIAAYTTLHEFGWAHSVEVIDREGRLAGGLYGVRVNGLFAGESMFHAQRDASKVALMALVRLMRDTGLSLLDVQWHTNHLESLGAVAVSRAQYLALLATAIERPVL